MAAAAAVTVSLAERNLKGEEKEKEKMRMRVGKLMGGMFTERGIGMTAVLSMKSVWAPDYGLGSALGAHEVKEDQEDRLKDVQARVYWPAREELKSSGEALFRRNHPRRLPLPRLNKVRKINRSVMASSDRWANFLKMEKGEVAIPFRMKEIKKLEDWDRKCLTAVWDRKKWLTVDIQVIKDEDMIERGWLGADLLAEL